MIYNKQLFKHEPKKGYFGDCHRTCLACILNISPEEIPNFGIYYDNPEKFIEEERKWHLINNIISIVCPYTGSIEGILKTQKEQNPNTYYILSGISKNDLGHSVVCLNDEIIWDPALDNSGIVRPFNDGYYWVQFIGSIKGRYADEDTR